MKTSETAPGTGLHLGAAEARILNVLRTKLLGADAGLIASLSGVSAGHARRCLERLAGRGLVERLDPLLGLNGSRRPRSGPSRRADPARSGAPGRNGSRRSGLWRLAAGAARHIQELPPLAPAESLDEDHDRIPEEFWDCFWSGTPARDLRVGADGLYIAEALINGRDLHARAWALKHIAGRCSQRVPQAKGL